MKNTFRNILSILTLFISAAVFSQSNEINIRFIGNCGLHMTDGKTNFYVDFPYKSGAHNYMEYDKSEIANVKDSAIFIFTHKHSDHYSKRLLRKLSGRKFGPWNIDELEKLNETVPDFSIQSFKTDHTVFGLSFKHYSYLITWHGKKIYFSGDTTEPETLGEQRNLDYAFIPAWLITPANEKGIKLREISKMYAIYHIGPKDKITLPETEKQFHKLEKQGEVITIP